MAHNLNFNEITGQHSFFSVQQKAWHGLGRILQDYPTSKEALYYAGLDYQVEKCPIFTSSFESDNPQSIQDYYATIRMDTKQVLGIVGRDYEVVQNTDAFAFFDSIVGGDGIQYETAGSLGKGERIFITAKLPGYIEVGNKDLIEKYLFLTTSHDGFGSITAAFTPVRVVCNNTLNAALNNHTNSIKIRHTANARERLEMAHTVLGITNRLSDQLTEMFSTWSKIKITDPQLLQLIRMAMVPNKEVLNNIKIGRLDELSTCFNNICNSVYEYAQTSPSQQTETTLGTVYGAYNAVTGYFQNVRSYKNEEAKLKSLLYGGNGQLKCQKAFQLCHEFSKS